MSSMDEAEEVTDPKRELGRAVRTLCAALSEDPDYRRGWTANIAMAFFDEVRRDVLFCSEEADFTDMTKEELVAHLKVYSKMTHDKLHGISNRAAEHFLDVLTMDTEKPEAKGSHSVIMDQKRRTRVARDVQEERDRQDKKWGLQNIDPFKFLAILMEEVGESSRAAIEAHHFGLDSWDDHKLQHYREEMIQTAAVAQQAVEAIDRRHWQRPEPSGG